MHRKGLALVGTLVSIVGVALCPSNARSQEGSITIQLNREVVVPGQRLDVIYETSPGTLEAPVDIYIQRQSPDGTVEFLQPNKRFAETVTAFRSDVTVRQKVKKLFRFYPIRQAFGTYTYSAVLVHAGMQFGEEGALASPIASSSFTFDPLSESQQSIIAERDNPDLLTLTWTAALKQKQELWFYYSDDPTLYTFLNGELTEQKQLSGDPGGVPPRIVPSLLTPQTTLEHLTVILGPPTTRTRFVDGARGYLGVSFSAGVDAAFINGRLVFADTFVP